MKAKTIFLCVAIIGLPCSVFGQTTRPATSPMDAKAIAKLLVGDVKNNTSLVQNQLIGRNDVLGELKKIMNLLSVEERQKVLYAATFGVLRPHEWKAPWIMSDIATGYLVDVATTDDCKEFRKYAASLLVEHVPSSYITIHAAELVKAMENGVLDIDVMLLGKTGAAAAKQLLDKKIKEHQWQHNDRIKGALAKLGDTKVSKQLVDAYWTETDPHKKVELVRLLGYVGDTACVVALAKDMRNPAIYAGPGCFRSLRLDIIAALSEVYPQEPVLWRRETQGGEKELDAWYAEVEQWIEGYMGITWSEARPKPFGVVPIPTVAMGFPIPDVSEMQVPIPPVRPRKFK